MPLAPGQSLSFYEILGPLGAGAMGEVHRARDTRLDREVAIKVLPEHFAEDEERLRRFEREAKTLASLNHPNVAGIYGVDQAGDVYFLALELVPGEDLAERLARGPLPVDEAIDVCRQIADGLEAAHEAGVVHRDLKPANVRITPEGVVKVLDFGMAKPMRPRTTAEGTSSAESDSFLVTEEGVVLGTPTYMSPEQARGKPVDRRTDVWAFGCVLYECLTGKRAFGGESMTDVLAAIVSDEPDWSALSADTPARLRVLLMRCLHKEPRSRLRDIGEARLTLESPMEEPTAAALGAEGRMRRIATWLAAGLVVGGALGFLARGPSSVEEPKATARQTAVHVPENQAVRSSMDPALAIAPDGHTLAWTGGVPHQLYVRSLDSFEIRPMPATENATCPFFSPDSRHVGFLKEGALMSISLSGGTPTKIAEVGGRLGFFRGASWGDDSRIVFSPSITSSLLRIPDSGGEKEIVTEIDPDSAVRTDRYPDVLPGAEVVLFTRDDKRTSEHYDDASIVARSLVTGEERVVVEGAGQARFAVGHVVFVRGADLYAQRFDPKTLTVSGSPRKIVSGVEYDTTVGPAQFDLARDGTLAYVPGLDRTQSKRPAWRLPGEQPVLFDLPPAPYRNPRASPDGRYISYTVARPDQNELWLYDLERKTARRRTRQGDVLAPIWSPTSDRIYFGSGLTMDPVIYELEVGGASAPRVVFEGAAGTFLVPSTITPDGRTIVAVVTYKDGRQDIIRVDAESGKSSELIATPSLEGLCAIDPSGEWLAFSALRTGELHVYLTTLEPGGPVLQVSRDPGVDPRWAPDGKRLYYLHAGARHLWAVDVEFGDRPILGIPRLVFEDFYWDASTSFHYDVAPDGRILSFVDIGGSELGREIRVQSTWLQESPGPGG